MFSLSPQLGNPCVCAHKPMQQFPETEPSSEHLPRSHLCHMCCAARRPRHSPARGDESETGNALKLLCQCLRLKDYPTVLNSATSCNVFSLRRSWKQRGLVIWQGEISHHFARSLRGQWDCDWDENTPKRDVPDNLCGPFLGMFLFFSSALLTNECQGFATKTPTQVTNISGVIGYHGLTKNIRFN